MSTAVAVARLRSVSVMARGSRYAPPTGGNLVTVGNEKPRAASAVRRPASVPATRDSLSLNGKSQIPQQASNQANRPVTAPSRKTPLPTTTQVKPALTTMPNRRPSTPLQFLRRPPPTTVAVAPKTGAPDNNMNGRNNKNNMKNDANGLKPQPNAANPTRSADAALDTALSPPPKRTAPQQPITNGGSNAAPPTESLAAPSIRARVLQRAVANVAPKNNGGGSTSSGRGVAPARLQFERDGEEASVNPTTLAAQKRAESLRKAAEDRRRVSTARSLSKPRSVTSTVIRSSASVKMTGLVPRNAGEPRTAAATSSSASRPMLASVAAPRAASSNRPVLVVTRKPAAPPVLQSRKAPPTVQKTSNDAAAPADAAPAHSATPQPLPDTTDIPEGAAPDAPASATGTAAHEKTVDAPPAECPDQQQHNDGS